MVLDEWLARLPQQLQGKERITALIEAFAVELDQLRKVFAEIITSRGIDTATGAQLDGIGDIVCLTRAEAVAKYGIEMTDEIYRLFLKYQMLRNTNQCTLTDLYTACKLLYGAQVISYKDGEAPATFRLAIGAELSPQTIDLLNAAGAAIKPAGVAATLSYYAMDFFGFKDTNEYALGFGVGKFAQSI